MVPIPLSQERLIPAPSVAVVGEVILAHDQRTNQATGFQGLEARSDEDLSFSCEKPRHLHLSLASGPRDLLDRASTC